MKNLRRLVVSLAVLLVALLCLTATVSAAEIVDSGECGDNLTWTLDDEGTLTISGTGEMDDYQSLEAPWIELDVRNVVLESGVTSIGDFAFQRVNDYLSNLTQLRMPDTLMEIGCRAFDSSPIQQIEIPNSVTKIDSYAFSFSSLSSITLSNKLKAINESVFDNCYNLETIVIPESVTKIEWGAFNSCSNLANITLSGGLTSIGGSAFKNCTSLTNITLPNGVKKIGESAFYGCTGLSDITLPDSLTSIGNFAFYNCTSLTNVTLPDDLTSVGNDAFSDCTGLTSIIIPESLTSISRSMFSGCKKLTSVTIPKSVTSIGDSAFSDCSRLTNVTIPNSVTQIGNAAFSGCKKITNITIPNSVTSMSESVFSECTGLTSITLPDGLTYISYAAFAKCSSLTSIAIPESVTVIEESAFSGCSSLIEIVIPDSVTYLGASAFKECSSAVIAYLPANLKKIPSNLFNGCSSLEAVILPASVTEIESKAFYGCDSLVEIYYLGDEDQLAQIQVGSNNDPLLYANVYLVTMITKEPEDAYVQEGETVKFSTDTSRAGTTYQWYYLAPDADEWKVCKQSGAKTKTLTVTATKDLDGYYFCCEITDVYGSVGETRAALLTIVKPPKITTQPKTTAAPEGSTAKVTVKAKGDGLEYQWYIKNPGKSKFGKSSVTSATYSCKMSEKTDGREVYCVVTDQYGNTVKSKTVTLYMGNPAKITTQPKNAAAPEGKVAKATVKATGDDITYTWYIKNPGKSKFSKSSVTSATYSCKMSEKTDGRQAYCVITDKYGTSVKTKTVTLYMGNPAKITTQPKNAVAAEGKTAKATVKATGDGLTYQWYIKNPGKSKFGKSSVTSATYSCKMSESTDGRQAYCVITDKYGISVQTETVTFYMGNPARITTQPRDAIAPAGEKVKTTVKATGDGITYQWYIKNPGKSKFGKSSVTSATYSCKMSESIDGRQAYCVVTDKYGTSVQSKTVTLSIGNPVAIVTQPQSVSAAAGETAKTTVEATGEGLTYQWYIRNPGKEKFGKSSVTSATYSCKVSETTDGREAYCVITDKYGNSVQSETVTITMEAEDVHVHTPKTVNTLPTCTSAGQTKTFCTECNEVLELVDNPEQPALGHDWVEISNTATCTEGGTKTSQCSRCDETISESSAAIGHVNTHAEIQKATCTEDGWEKIICDDCGIQIGSTTILAARGSHSYETAVLADAAKDYSNYEGSNKYDAYLEYSDISCQRCKDCYIIDENTFAYRYSAEEVTTMMLSYVNALRKENGLSELTAGESMIALADERAEEIAFNFTQATEHTENAAQAVVFSDCVQYFYNLFAESAAHSANMLAEDAVTFGCAIYYNNGVVYCVQVFE